MAHSYRRHSTFGFVGVEALLFAGAAVSTYFSSTTNWPGYWITSAILLGLFLIVRVAEVIPHFRELLAFEDAAAHMASSAMRYGVQRFYNMQNQHDQDARNTDTVAEINSADAMWLCANSGASYLDPSVYRHWTAIQARLDNRVPFRIVLLDPTSDAKQQRNKLNIGEEADDSKINLPNLVRLYNDYPNLDIRFVKDGMHATVFYTPSCMFYDPYHVGVVGRRIENRSFCLKLSPAIPKFGLGYYNLLRTHFDSLWRDSQDFESWVDANNEQLPQRLPALQRRHDHG